MSTKQIAAVVIGVALFMAQAARAEELHAHLTGEFTVVIGDWVNGLHGDGIDWGETVTGHCSAVFRLSGKSKIRYWLDKANDHVVAVEYDYVKVSSGEDVVGQEGNVREFIIPPNGAVVFHVAGGNKLKGMDPE